MGFSCEVGCDLFWFVPGPTANFRSGSLGLMMVISLRFTWIPCHKFCYDQFELLLLIMLQLAWASAANIIFVFRFSYD